MLELVYETCVAFEREQSATPPFRRQAPIPVIDRGNRSKTGHRADPLLDDKVTVEVKAIQRTVPAHKSQVLTYPGMSGCEVALLFNCNELHLRDGLRRSADSKARPTEPPA